MSQLHSLLHYQTLTGIVNDPRGGLPTQNIPPAFFNVTRRVPGDSLTYYRVAGTRQTAIVALRASESQRRQLQGITEHTAKALFVHEHIFHDVDVLNMLRDVNNPARQEMGRQEIARQAAYTRQYLDNFRAASIASALLMGKIHYSIGEPLLGSGGTEIDYGIPAGNRNALDVFGDGALIGASWAVAGTPIVTHVEDIKNAALRKTGYPLRHAFYGSKMLEYLLANNQVKELLKANTALSAAFTARTIPSGFLGLEWHNGAEFFFEQADGTIVTPVGEDDLVLTPDPSPDWWDVVEGSYEVPTDLGSVTSDATQAIGNFATVSGRFNYATISKDPSGIKHNYGDTFLPILKVPGAVFHADVTP